MNETLQELYHFMLCPRSMFRLIKVEPQNNGEHWIWFAKKFEASNKFPPFRVIKLKPNGQHDWYYSRAAPK